MPRPRSRPSRQFLEDSKRMQEKRQLREVGMLTGGQAKIAAKAPPTNKIDEKDFAVLRAEKAKDRGMGLQDEKVKPGKVMKAKRGKAIEKLAKKKGLPVPLASSIPGGTKKGFFKAFGQFPAVTKSKSSAGTTAKSAMGKTFAGYSKVFKTGVSAGDKAKATSTIIGVKPTLPKPSKESSLARRALRGVKATSLGKRLLPVVAAGVAAQQFLKSKMKKKEDKNKKMLKDYREQKKPGVPSQKTQDINKALNRLNSKKMGGGMMKVPGYSSGTTNTVTIKDGRIALTDPKTPRAGRPKAPPPPRKRRLPQQARRTAGRAGLGALGGTGRKEDSSVTLGKFMKAKTDALNESVLAGGMKKERITQGSNMRRPEAFVRDVEAGKYKKPNKDAAYYKSIGLTGKRGDRAVKDFFKPEDIRLKNIMAGNYMGGGMMNKPMGYKSGKSIKVKCKLGKNKPTKMY